MVWPLAVTVAARLTEAGAVKLAPVAGEVSDTTGAAKGLTVRVKLVLVLSKPSLTVRVIVAVPVCPLAGVTVTERLAPLPPKTILTLGTRVGLEELAVTPC